MGLDVYLYKYKDYWGGRAAEEVFHGLTKDLEEDKSISDEARQAKIDEIGSSIGCLHKDQYGSWVCENECIEIESKKYPEHLFKIGYFRSSYNGGGMEKVLGDMGVPSLHTIFRDDNNINQYDFVPNWNACKTRATHALIRFDKIQATDKGKHYVVFISQNPFMPDNIGPRSESEALQLYVDQVAQHAAMKHGSEFRSYGCAQGKFYLDGCKLKAAVPGRRSFGDLPGAYLIIERAGETGLEWYRQALEIILETIEYVLSHTPEEQKQFALHWSG